jgi:2-polyprenyl-3-methyl-5-hydroxy-6-metoxy-1,4-benzoquinol methylase
MGSRAPRASRGLAATRMEQTPLNISFNGDLLALIPRDASRIVEVGCSGGGLAQAFRRLNPSCEFIGIELNSEYAEVARQHCTRVVVGDIEHMSDATFESLLPVDCWIFADVLEHLYDPWSVLQRIREKTLLHASVVACIPNAQHWSVQARLNCGAFQYEDRGLMDRTHIRWFTKQTIEEMFHSCGFAIMDGRGRILDESHREAALVGVRAFAEAIGADVELATVNATPLQYLIRAVPV